METRMWQALHWGGLKHKLKIHMKTQFANKVVFFQETFIITIHDF
jgi:hypothetical protein